MTPRQKEMAVRIFTRLGEAEAKVHGTTIRKVHFHEVGAVDSIADIVGSAIGWDLLGVDRIECSPIPTGSGHVEIAHGRVSVPAPATAELLTGIPLAASDIEAELTTPTGASIVATLARSFGPLPAMTIARIGYGAGTRDLQQQANLVRLYVGTTADSGQQDIVWQLATNLDDTTGEVLGYCTERLMQSGALDVYTTSIQMKKNRPGVLLTVLCDESHVAELETLLFRETSTLGIRKSKIGRQKLARTEHAVTTVHGEVTGKVATLPDGTRRFSPEYEDCRRLAMEKQLPLEEVMEAARRAFDG